MAEPTPKGSEADSVLSASLGPSEASLTETGTIANTAASSSAMETFPPDIGNGGFGGFAGEPEGPESGNRPHGPPAGRPTLWTTQMPYSTTTLLAVGTTTVPSTPGASGGVASAPLMPSGSDGEPSASSIIYNSSGISNASALTVNGSSTVWSTITTIATAESVSGSGFAGALSTITYSFPVTSGGTAVQSNGGSVIPVGASALPSTITSGGFGAGTGASPSASSQESESGADNGSSGGLRPTSTATGTGSAGTAALGSESGDGTQVSPSLVSANDQALGQQTRLGIGVAVAVWALITVILFTWWWFYRRRQMQNGSFQRFEDFDAQRDMMEYDAAGPVGPGTGAGAVIATAYGADRAASIRSGGWGTRRMSHETNPGLRSHPIPTDREMPVEEHSEPIARYSRSEISSISDYDNIHPTEPVFALPDFPLPAHTMPESSRGYAGSEPSSAPPYTWTDRSATTAAQHQTADPKSGTPSPPTVTTPDGQTVYAYIHPSHVQPAVSDPIPSLPFYSPGSIPRRMRSGANNSEYTASEYSADPRSPGDTPALPALPANLPHGFPTGIPKGIANLTSNGFSGNQFFALPPGAGRLNAWPEENRRRSRMASLHNSMHESITEEDEFSLKQSIQHEERQPITNYEGRRPGNRLSRLSSGNTRPMSVMSMRELIARRSIISVQSSDTRF